MADDDIDRLLRELDAFESGGAPRKAQPPAPVPATATPASAPRAEPESKPGGIKAAATQSLVAGGVAGVGTAFAGVFIPFLGGPQFGIGGFVGGFAAWFVSRLIR